MYQIEIEYGENASNQFFIIRTRIRVMSIIYIMVQILKYDNVVARLIAESSRYGPLFESISQLGMVQNVQWPGKSPNYRAKTRQWKYHPNWKIF